MSEFKKLFQAKRILAMILAVAMVVTMLPQTTYAAAVTDSTSAQSEDAESPDVAEAEETSGTDTVAEENAIEESAPAADGEGEEESSSEEESEEPSEAAPLVTSVTINLDGVETTKEYTGAGVFASLATLKTKVTVTVDGEEVTPEDGDLTLTWKAVAADGTLADLPDGTTVPVNAGKYKLSVALAARDNKYKAATIESEIEFTITPAALNVIVTVDDITAGTKAGEITVQAVAYDVNNDPFSYVADDQAASDLTVTVSVRDAITGIVLGADEALLKTGDYVMDFTAAFTETGKTKANGNYTIQPIASKDVVISSLITSYVNVTLADTWKDAGKITYTYTDKEITAPVNGTDFTAKVQYDSGKTDEDGAVIYTDIENAQTVEEWYVLKVVKEYTDTDEGTASEGCAEKEWEWVKLDTAPTEVGSYVYRISYAGQTGVYTESYADITVVIEPIEVVLKPELATGAKFYHEMTEADVLAQIDYQAYYAANPEKKVDNFDKTTAWGTSYDDVYMTQFYEPVFVLQYETKNEDGNTIWEDNNGENLDNTKKYRVIFGGYKTVYYSDGYTEANDMLPINEAVNSIDINYLVDTDYENVLSKYVADITVEEGTATTIDVSEITKALDGKGDSLSNVYTKVYDGTQLYAERADYKKAIVKAGEEKIAKDTDDSITYTWYRHVNDDITDYEFSDETNEPYADEENNTFDNPDNWEAYRYYVSPAEAGIYKLEISYKDEDKDEYRGSTACVYYVIEKQPVKVTFSGEYTALTGTTISDFFTKFYNEQWDTFAVQAVNGTETTTLDWTYYEDYYVNFYIEEVLMVEQTDESGNTILVPQTSGVYYSDKDGVDYKVVDAEGNQVEKESVRTYSTGSNATFKENAQYKLTADLSIYEGYADNYTNEKVVVENLTILKDETENIKEVHKVRSYENLNDKADIQIEKMGTTALSIKVDADKLGTLEKEYDGNAFDLNAVLGEGAVKVVKAEDGTTEVTDLALTYEWHGTKYYGTVGRDGYWSEAVDAGEYTLYVSFAGDTTYTKVDRVEVATVNITPKNLTVTPVVNNTIVAGQTPYNVWRNVAFQQAIVMDGYVDNDEFAFDYMSDCYHDAWGSSYLTCAVYDEEGNTVSTSSRLKGDKTYTIKVTSSIKVPYSVNYNVEYKEASFTTVRGNSEVFPIMTHLTNEYLTNKVENGAASASIRDEITGMSHVITTLDAIPYSYHTLAEDGSRTEGNFLEVYITVPAEYNGTIPSTAMYENSIEAQGGIAIAGSGYIYVILDASEKDIKTFDIRWEDGYVEHFTFDFTKSELMGNLAEAVAPKTLAFNSPVTKMAVGEVQALDLKMTKVQKNDVVCIAYDVDNKDVLSVDEKVK